MRAFAQLRGANPITAARQFVDTRLHATKNRSKTTSLVQNLALFISCISVRVS